MGSVCLRPAGYRYDPTWGLQGSVTQYGLRAVPAGSSCACSMQGDQHMNARCEPPTEPSAALTSLLAPYQLAGFASGHVNRQSRVPPCGARIRSTALACRPQWRTLAASDGGGVVKRAMSSESLGLNHHPRWEIPWYGQSPMQSPVPVSGRSDSQRSSA